MRPMESTVGFFRFSLEEFVFLLGLVQTWMMSVLELPNLDGCVCSTRMVIVYV